MSLSRPSCRAQGVVEHQPPRSRARSAVSCDRSSMSGVRPCARPSVSRTLPAGQRDEIRSPCRVDELCLSLRRNSMVRSSPNLERMWSFSLLFLLLSLFFSFFYSLQFSSPHQNDPNCSSGNLILSLSHWFSLISPYPLIQTFGFPSS